MTREEVIEKAAEHYAELVNKEYDISPGMERIVKSAYQVGAAWADNNPVIVWHDTSEEPEYGEDIVALDNNGFSVSGIYKEYNCKGIYRHNCCLCEWNAVATWTYASYLLPKTK